MTLYELPVADSTGRIPPAMVEAPGPGGYVLTGNGSGVATFSPPTTGGVVPLHSKIKGANITVKPAGHGWPGLWAEWDWANWVKPQVDRAASLGLNCVRVIGAPECALIAPVPGTLAAIATAQYVANWTQLAAYCLSRQMWLYPCLVQKWDFEDVHGGPAPGIYQAANVTAVVTATAQALATYPNVIGFDCFQEGDTVGNLVVADVLAMFAAVRSVAPLVPVTCSDSSGNYGSAAAFWSSTSGVPYQAATAAGGSDFLDLHVYLDGVGPADADPYLTRVGKPVLFGEYGDSQDQSQSAITARYQAAAALHNRRGVIGSLAWALADQSTTNTNQWGVWDNTGFSQPSWPSSAGSAPLSTTAGQRTYITSVLPTFAVADKPVLPYPSPNLLTAQQARPVNVASGPWVTGANTYLFSDPRGQGFSATAAGTTQVSASGAPVVPTTWYEASVPLMAAATGRTTSLQIDWYDATNTYITSSTAQASADVTAQRTTVTTIARSPSNAATATLTVKVTTAELINESHFVLPGSYLVAL